MRVYILLFLIIGTTYGYADWTAGLLENIRHLTDNINNNVHQLQQRIQADVRSHLVGIDHLNRDIAKQIDETNYEMAKNPTIIINGNSGTSRSVISGTLPNGEPYFHDVEERVIGGILHRFESVYNPKTRGLERYHTTLDLKDRNAKPVHVPNVLDRSAPEEAKAPSAEEVKTPEEVKIPEVVKAPEQVKAPEPAPNDEQHNSERK